MHTIIINTEMEEAKDAILADLLQVFSTHGISCEVAHPASNVIVIYPTVVGAEPELETSADVEAAPDLPEDPNQLVVALPIEEPIDSAADIEEPVAAPEAPPVTIACKVMSLSSNTDVPATVSQEAVSMLMAQDVQVMGEFVLFNFCGNVYKYPVEPQSGPSAVVCNTSTEYSDRNIRVALQFEGSETTYPVVLAVTEKNDLPFSIVLGKDLSDLINTVSLGSLKNGEISA